jgi:hypothetical protein
MQQRPTDKVMISDISERCHIKSNNDGKEILATEKQILKKKNKNYSTMGANQKCFRK